MNRPPRIDYDALEDRGFTIVPGLIGPDRLAAFEAQVAALGAAACRRLRITPTAEEPFVDLCRRGGGYWSLFYKLLERLFVLERMNTDVGERLAEWGFLDWAGFVSPAIWPDIRADPPDDGRMLLRVHQDFASTRCHRAWRLWVPLRRADPHRGTMRVYPGSHKHGLLPHDMDDARYPVAPERYWRDAPSEAIELPAGDGVLFHPLLLHESVPNRSARMKFTLLEQVQDLASLCDPDDPDDAMAGFIELTERRAAARAADERRRTEAPREAS